MSARRIRSAHIVAPKPLRFPRRRTQGSHGKKLHKTFHHHAVVAIPPLEPFAVRVSGLEDERVPARSRGWRTDG